MNKIFKVVWSKTKECYVVVSEVAKNNGGKKKVLASVLAGLAMVGVAAQMGTPVQAGANNSGNAVNLWADKKLDGSNNTANTVGANSVAVGNNLVAGSASTTPTGRLGGTAIAIGADSQAKDDRNIAIGYNNTTEGQDSVAMGSNVIAGTGQSIAIGSTNTDDKGVQTQTIARGKVTMKNGRPEPAAAIAIGAGAQAIDGSGVLAMGQLAYAKGNNDVAIGTQTKVIGNNSTAIGSTAQALGNSSAAYGTQAIANGLGATAVGPGANAGTGDDAAEGATAVGRGAKATKEGASALGWAANASVENAAAIGRDTTANIAGGVALGYQSVTTTAAGVQGYNPASDRTDKYSTQAGAVGTSTLAAVSIGEGVTKTRQLTGLAAGTEDTDAVNVAQLKNVNLKYAGDTGNSDVLLKDHTLNINGDTDTFISTSADANGVKITAKVAKNITANADGKAVAPTTNGIATTDNVTQAINNSGWKVTSANNGGTTNGSSSEKVSPGDTVTFSAGKNIVLDQAGKQFTYSLSSTLKDIESIQNGASKITLNNGGGTTISGGNLSVDGNKITNVAPGTDDTDAVNYKQLKAAKTVVEAGTNVTVAKTTGANGEDVYTVNATAGGTASTESVVKKAAATGDTNIADVSVAGGKNVNDPGAQYEVSVSKNAVKDAAREAVTVNNGGNTDNPITVTPTDDAANHNTTYAVTFDGDKAAKQIPLTYKANGTGDKTVTLDKGLDFTNGTNTTAEIGNDGVVKFNLNDNVTLTNAGSLTVGDTKVNNDGLTINGGPSVTTGGIDAGSKKITNVEKGTADTDAVNVKQLKDSEKHIKPDTYTVANDGSVTLKYVDGNGTEQTETAKITGIAKKSKVIDGQNTTVEEGTDTTDNSVTYKVNVKGDLANISSITNGAGSGKISFAGDQVVNVEGDHPISLNGKDGYVTGLQNKDWNITNPTVVSGRAATEDQLKKVSDGFNNTVKLAGNTGNTDTQKLNQNGGLSFGVVGANNGQYIKTTASGTDVVADLSDDAKAKLNHTVEVAPGSNNVTVTTDTTDPNKTVYKVAVANTTTGAASTESVVKKADAAGDTNIADVTVGNGKNSGDPDAQYEVNVSKNAVKDAAREAVTVNNGGNTDNPITVTPTDDATNHNTTYAVTFDGDKAAKQIPLTYKANGTGDKTVTLDKGLDFTNGTNTTAEIGNDGVVKFNLNDNVTLTNAGSLTVGDTKVNNDGLTINGGPSVTTGGIDAGSKKITNVEKGTADTDAVNVKQLKDSEKHIKPDTYTVANDGSVTLKYVDGNGTEQTETAKITGIAKKSKVIDGQNTTVEEGTDTTDNSVTYKVNVKGDLANISSITNGAGSGKISFAGDQVVNVEGDHPISLNGKDGYVTGLQNKDWNITNPTVVSGRAATEDQLKKVSDGFNNTIKLAGNTGNTDTQKFNKTGGLSFGVVGANNGQYIKTTASGTDVVADLSDDAKAKLNHTVEVAPGSNNVTVTTDTTDPNKTVYKVAVANTTTGAASTESVVKKADAAGDTNIADVTVGNGKNSGDPDAQYEVNVSKNAVKDAAREAVTVNNGGNTDNPITVTPTDDATNHNTTYAVTFDGDKAAKQIPLTYKANGTGDKTVTLDKGLDFTNGTNTTAEIGNDGVVKFNLNDNVTLTNAGSLTVGDTKVNNDGLTINGGPSVTTGGIDAGSKKITNVEKGTADTDAVNVKQLKDSEKHIKPDTYTVANDGSVTLKYVDGNGTEQTETAKITGIAKQDLSNIDNAGKQVITGLGTVVKAGDNVTVSEASDATTGQKTYTVNAVTPAVYTKADGTKVVKRPDGTFTTNVDGAPGNDVPASDVIVSFQDAAGNTTGGNSIVNNVGSAIDKTGTSTGDTFLTNLNTAATDNPFAAVNVRDLKSTADALKSSELHIAPTAVKAGSTEAKGGEVKGTENVYKYDAATKKVTLTYNDGNGKAVTDTKAVIDFSDLNVPAGGNNYGFKANATANGGTVEGTATETAVENGGTINYAAGKNLTVKQDVDAANKTHTYTYSLDKDLTNLDKVVVNGKDGVAGKDGVTIVGPQGATGATGIPGTNGIDGKVGITGKDGKDAVSIAGKDGVGTIGLTGPQGPAGTNGKSVDISTENGTKTLVKPEANNNDQSQRIVYVPKDANGNPLKDADNNDIKREVATMDDGLRFTGNNTSTENKQKLGSLVKVEGEGVTEAQANSFQSAAGNIAVVADGADKLTVKLNKDLKDLTSVTTEKVTTKEIGLKDAAGNTTTIKKDGDRITYTNDGGTTNKTVATLDDEMHIKDTTYTVDANKKVTLTYVDGNSKDVAGKKAIIDLSGLPVGDKDTDMRIKEGDYTAKNGSVTLNTVDKDGNTVAGKDVVIKGINTNNYVAGDNVTFTNNGNDANGNPIVKINAEVSTEQVVAKAGNDNLATVAPATGSTQGGKNATYEVNVDKTNLENKAEISYKANGGTAQKTTLAKGFNFTSDDNSVAITTGADGKVNFKVDTSNVQGKAFNLNVNKEGTGKVENAQTAAATPSVEKGTKFVAGNNLSIRHDGINGDANYDHQVTYALNSDLKGITSITNNGGATMNFGPNEVSITGGNLNMGGNKITNVKNGTDKSDVATVGQLTKVTSNDNTVAINKTTDADGAPVYDLSVQGGGRDPRVDELGEEVGRVGAQGAALAALKPIQYDPLEPTQIMAGYGNYRGNSAVALGVAHYKNESTLIHGGVSWAGGSSHMMANAGVTWKVGNRDSEAAVADRYRKGPISSAYAMQQEMASVKAQNAGLKTEVSDLKAENEQMKAQIAAMMAKLGM